MTDTTRVLFAERISFDRADSQSIEGQDFKLEARASEKRAEGQQIGVVGRAVDRSVSGDINMSERPKLGQWLTAQGREQWDEIWVTTQDRLSRNDMHFMSFVFNMIQWGKTLIVLDDPSLDLTTPEGRGIAHIKAIGPHRELERIKDRVRSSHEQRRFTPRWHGGFPPYGYTTEQTPLPPTKDGKTREGKVLVLDEYMCSVLHEVRNWLVHDGDTLHGAAQKLNARGERTSKDLWRERNSREVAGTQWAGGNLKQVLTSQSCLGVKLDKGKPMYNRDGSPFVVASPVFDDDEWQSLQSAIKDREINRTRRHGASPLLGVTFCEKCKKSALQTKSHLERPGGGNRYYRCTNPDTKCPGVIMRADYVEELVEQEVLEQIGDADVPRKVWEPGEDHTTELRDLDKKVERLRSDRDAGLYDDDDEYYRTMMKGYMERRKELAKLPQRESGWKFYDTGVTYRQAWEKYDEQERRKLLIDAGVQFFITSSRAWRTYVPEDILDRVRNAS